MGGECTAFGTIAEPQTSSSPRGRGMPGGGDVRVIRGRFIPAWAGNARYIRGCSYPNTVHPRVGGECSRLTFPATRPAGSSPRERGMRAADGEEQPLLRFIPAWAGNAQKRRVSACPSAVHPRVGGECDSLRR